MMLLIFKGAGWYADNSSLPRYCESPRQTVAIVEEILTSDSPADGEVRRPYIIAAKLIFLVPQENMETIEAYKSRLRIKISQSCGVRF